MQFLKKHYKIIIFLLVVFLIYLIFQKTNFYNLNYTALGDGFAKGIDSYERVDYGYSDYLRDYFKKNLKLNFYTKAFTSKDMSIKELTYDIVTSKKVTLNRKKLNLKETIRESDFLTLTIGLNDLLYKISITSNLSTEKLAIILEEINKDFSNLIEEIKKYYPNDIYFIGYYERKSYPNYLNYAIRKMNNLFSKNENIIFISTEKLFKENKKLTSNPKTAYPNNFGYQEIANLIIEKIKAQIKDTK